MPASAAAATTTTTSSAAPSPSLLPCLHGHAHGRAYSAAAACCLLVLVTFLVVLAACWWDPRTREASSWFLSLPPPPPPRSAPSSFSSLTTAGSGVGGREHLLATASSYYSDDGGGGGRNSTGKEVHQEVRGHGGYDRGFLSFVNSSFGYDEAQAPLRHFSVAPPPSAPAPASPVTGGSDEVIIQATPPQVEGRRDDVKLERLELGLARARSAIMEAIRKKDKVSPLPDKDYVPMGPVYRNAHAFHRSYLEMERQLKVYVYEEGEPPVFHDGPCRSIYSTEGRFIHSMETETETEEGRRLRTRDPARAHVFFLPFSVVKMVQTIYEPGSRDMAPLKRTVADYVRVLSSKYPYWNRSLGADHFMLSCHDWGPYVSSANAQLFGNSIRVLCNANTSEGFDPARDVSLPEVNLRSDAVERQVGGPSASRRPVLAFFAGGNHGPVRPALLAHWGRGDPDVRVSEYLPRGGGGGAPSYADMMRRSRFCLCPGGYEVASPRLAEALYLGCVPVVVDDGEYALPFADVLDWDAFALRLRVADIPRLKEILAAVSPRQYIRMQRRVRMVRRHFMLHGGPPRRYDAFHMILHSVWLRRLNVRIAAAE